MSDVRSLSQRQVAAPKIQHRYSTYTSSENVLTFDRSQELLRNNPTAPDDPINSQNSNKKRKTTNDDDHEIRKRLKPTASLSTFLPSIEQSSLEVAIPTREINSVRKSEALVKSIDEEEWAAFEADIAESERLNTVADAVISAPPLTTDEIKRKSSEEDFIYKNEREEEKSKEEEEEAAQKMVEELEKMAMLEAKVNRLRARREELLRQKRNSLDYSKQVSSINIKIISHRNEEKDEDDDVDLDEDEDDDMWNNYMVNR